MQALLDTHASAALEFSLAFSPSGSRSSLHAAGLEEVESLLGARRTRLLIPGDSSVPVLRSGEPARQALRWRYGEPTQIGNFPWTRSLHFPTRRRIQAVIKSRAEGAIVS